MVTPAGSPSVVRTLVRHDAYALGPNIAERLVD